MAITILPRDYNPWVQALPSMLQNMAIQKMSQRFQGGQAEKLEEERRKTGIAELQSKGYVESEAHVPDVDYGGKGFMQPKSGVEFKQMKDGTVVPVYSQQRYGKKDADFLKTGTAIKATQPPNLVRQYNFSMNQYLGGKGKFPGSFTAWKKSVAKAGASRISIGEKVQEAEAKSNLKIRQAVKSTKFPDEVAQGLKIIVGDNWEMMDEYAKQDAIFRAMDKKIKEAYPKQQVVFDDRKGVEGWYAGNTLIRKWVDLNKHRSDKRH